MSVDSLTGYGTDTWCSDRYAPGRTASRRLLVAQALYRRLITPRGTLQGGEAESAYGIDLTEYIGAVDDPSLRAALPAMIRAELLKDDRVLDVSAEVTVTGESTSRALIVTVRAALVDEASALQFTASVSDVGIQLLGVTT